MPAAFSPLDYPDAEISRGVFCQFAGCAKITAYRRERNDPSWPRPIVRGNRVFYKSADCKRYLDSGANADGSTTIYFAPSKPAAAKDGNWVQTVPGKGWFTILRLYGPEESFFTKTWQPTEIELVR